MFHGPPEARSAGASAVFFIQKSLSAARRGFFYAGNIFCPPPSCSPTGRTVPYRRRRNFRAPRFLPFHPPPGFSFSVHFPPRCFLLKKDAGIDKKNQKKVKKRLIFLQLGVDTFLFRVYIHYHRRAGLLHGSTDGV